MPRSPIPQMIEDFHQMTPEERACFLDLVDPRPEPEPAKSQKKAGKKSPSRSGSKSPRASGMASAISRSLESSRKATADDKVGKGLIIAPASDEPDLYDAVAERREERCQFTRADNKPCHLLPDHNIHHLESANEYHPFVPPAQSADGQSSTSNAATGSTVSSAMEKGAAGNAAGGSNG